MTKDQAARFCFRMHAALSRMPGWARRYPLTIRLVMRGGELRPTVATRLAAFLLGVAA